MKKATNRILNYSLLGLLCASFGSGALAGIRVGSQNASYANSSKNKLGLQQQYQNYLAQQAQAAQEAQGLPVPVADVELAESIQNGTGTSEVNRDVLSRCAMIYPNGEFVWDKPTIGHMAGGPATCVAVVEMRVMGQGVSSDGKEYIAVARGKLAAGDIMKCDIDSFPQSTYLPDIVNINFPSDERPTREDVIKALNEEQKNKAGLKIGGAVLTGLIAGNVLGENDPGKNSPLGLSKSKLKSSLIGGLAAGGVMTASTMGGKVVGDVVLGTGVNAMAGALTGNMYDAISGGGEALLKIEKCSNNNTNEETTCLWGIRKKYGAPVDGDVYYNPVDKKAKVCKEDENGNTKCSGLSKVELGYFKDTQNNTHPVSYLDGKVYSSVINQGSLYTEKENESDGFDPDEGGQWVKLEKDTTKNVSSTSAALIWDFPESRKGSKPEDWKKWETQNAGNIQICDRDGKGNAYNCETSNNAEGFSPITRTAADGAIVDLSDKTRKKDTLKGAGVGGAVGGFSAYQGAQDDIEARWVQASDEYDASLKNFYCGTGIKFLAEYKHDAEIPQMAEE